LKSSLATVEKELLELAHKFPCDPPIPNESIKALAQKYVYVPPAPKPNICDVPDAEADEMIAKATQGQWEHMKNDLYERVNSEGIRTRPEEVDRLWALADRVRKQLGQKPRSEKYKPGYKIDC
jgi:hypothetical protein